eukprot:11183699-Lingulodinium_polyedra.AAC.1
MRQNPSSCPTVFIDMDAAPVETGRGQWKPAAMPRDLVKTIWIIARNPRDRAGATARAKNCGAAPS